MNRKKDPRAKIFKGIENGQRVFCGPRAAQIDLTDKCNNSCICCWLYSPLVDKKESLPKGPKELSYRLVKKLIIQLSRLGTKEIILSGGGEPFMHPQIMKIIKLIKSKGIYLNVITNTTLLNKEICEQLVKLKVDLITASVWAGTSKAYSQTHPGKSAKDFENIRQGLKEIALHKKARGSLLPHVKVYNVLCAYNYDDVEAMIDFAKDTDADSVEFQAVDIIKARTDFLALSQAQVKEVFEQLKRVRQRQDMAFYDVGRDSPVEKFIEEEFSDFGKLWKNYKQGFKLGRHAQKLICQNGRQAQREDVSHAHQHNVTSISPFKYNFYFKDDCLDCGLGENSCEAADSKAVEVSLLNILGVGTVMRRLSGKKEDKSTYDKKVNSIPCYVGWYYARVMTDGSVIPCCKASGFALGNINKSSFSRIWKSPAYKEFRFKAKNASKTDPYFSRIGCLKSCDNWGMNLEFYEEINKRRYSKDYKIELRTNKDATVVGIAAAEFTRGNFNPRDHSFGQDLIIDGGISPGFAEYDFFIEEPKQYTLYSRYASKDCRPVDIFIDNKPVKSEALANNTGGWSSRYLQWYQEAAVDLEQGKHTLKIFCPGLIPHIERFVFAAGAWLELAEKKDSVNYFLVIKKDIFSMGLKATLKKIARNLKGRYLKDRYLEILSIYDGRHGYKGPFHVQIDLTNDCNNNCIACWCNSPFFKKPRLSPEEKKQYLPLGMAKEVIDEISKMGATEVYYSGSGEPFMHPQIMEVLEYTKKKNLTCHVNTNFTLLSKEKIDCLINMGVDFLTVSTWAATPQTYISTHPNRTEDDFLRIKENLVYLNRRKKDKPHIKLYNVIFNLNYFEVERMVDFAHQTGSESVEFTLVDTMPGVTDVLCLDAGQLKALRGSCVKIQSSLNKHNKVKGTGILMFQFDQFLRRISVAEDAKEAKYDRNIIDSMPCYIGWLFARIIPNGQVHSCLKAHRDPTGSLYSERFSEIWNSKKQAYFRQKTLCYEKKDPFFRLIGNDPNIEEAGCYKSCDDIGRNSWMHNRMMILSRPEKLVFKVTAKALKALRKVKSKTKTTKRDNPVAAGINHGRRAFCGPEQVVIDPTNRCNLKCSSCWLYSPLLDADKPENQWLGRELPKDTLISLIVELSSLGTKRIRFTGGGEPFMHKGLMEAVERACQKNLLTAITTNFGLVSKSDIKRLVELGLEELCVSLWASNPQVYQAVHPGAPANYFEKVKENLTYLKEIKKDKPRVTFANVIMNSNFRDFEDMYQFARDYAADAVYFTISDIFKGQTDKLLLDEEQRKELLEKALEVKEQNTKGSLCLEFYSGFLRRLSEQGSFSKGEYDKKDVNKIPCYAGWTFSRVLADGSVAPCCRGVKKVMGNINKSSFKDIWHSLQYNEFRAKAKYLPKHDPYFKEIGCAKECDNLMHNIETHKEVINGG